MHYLIILWGLFISPSPLIYKAGGAFALLGACTGLRVTEASFWPWVAYDSGLLFVAAIALTPPPLPTIKIELNNKGKGND